MAESRRDSHSHCSVNRESEETHLPSEASYGEHDPPDRLIAIVGPTAAGKTDLAIRLSQHIPLQVIGADSRQVYRYMDIGTAKPSLEERNQVTHHLIDIVDPDGEFSLGQYMKCTEQAIKNAKQHGQAPILVGGTGQYVMAILEGWQVPAVSPDPELRARLEGDLAAYGIENLLDELRGLDATASEAVDQQNARRVIRAIERARSGHLWGEQPARVKPSFESIVVGISGDRAELHSRADQRLEEMMSNGFLDEVEWLLEAGYSPELPAMSGIGYSELADHLLNGTELQAAVQRAKYRTHRYIRQQSNWFKQSDERITWFGISDVDDAVDFLRTIWEP